MKKNQLLQSVVCTAVFALVFGMVVSCGGHSMMPMAGLTNSATVVTLAANPKPTNSIFTASGHNVSVASMFGWIFANETTTLGQSFQGVCSFGNNPFGPDPNALGAHAEYGDTGFVPLNIVNFEFSCGPISGNAAFTPLPAIGAGESSQHGAPIFFSGNIAVLVAFAITRNGQHISCHDTTSTVAVDDGQLVMPYLRLSDNTVLLGSGSTQLIPSCQLKVPTGDDISQLNVYWAKN